tara:strand:+ start:1590 stop:2453 length:864 start_codon:yes stop_codon:yes gene_type:complete
MNVKPLFSHKNKEPENSVLYLVGTPIGNLEDISLRAINILQNVDLIACEDTRHTKKLLNKYQIKNNLISFNKFNSSKRIPKIIENLKEARSVALVSDAGMPCICDPGEELVNSVKSNGFNIICVPGPCAALVALVTSGLPTSKFIFEGFLPRKKIDREKILFDISQNSKTTIIYESPHHLISLLKDLKEYCGGSREITISRELTKKFEEHSRTNLDDAINNFENITVLGEYTLILSGKIKDDPKVFDELIIKKELHELVKAGLSLSAASKYLAKKKKLAKNLIYKLY